jgi:hypothetical protein
MSRHRHLAAVALVLLIAPTLGGASASDPAPAQPVTLAALAQPRVEAPRFGAVYASVSSYGLATSLGDRGAARGAAEAQCQRRGGDCRLVGEFAQRCGAVARAVDREVLFSLRPLDGASVGPASLGAGESQDEASRAAVRACAEGGTGHVCLVVAAACGGR